MDRYLLGHSFTGDEKRLNDFLLGNISSYIHEAVSCFALLGRIALNWVGSALAGTLLL